MENLNSHFANLLKKVCGHPVALEELLTEWNDLKQSFSCNVIEVFLDIIPILSVL